MRVRIFVWIYLLKWYDIYIYISSLIGSMKDSCTTGGNKGSKGLLLRSTIEEPPGSPIDTSWLESMIVQQSSPLWELWYHYTKQELKRAEIDKRDKWTCELRKWIITLFYT